MWTDSADVLLVGGGGEACVRRRKREEGEYTKGGGRDFKETGAKTDFKTEGKSI